MKGNMIDTAKPGPTFDSESMRAILDGRKTQTRRMLKGPFFTNAKLQKIKTLLNGGIVYETDRGWGAEPPGHFAYRVGGVYYARESLCKGPYDEVCYHGDMLQVVDEASLVHWPWKCRVLAPHCMPRWAARVFLRIVDVRVQRLGEITDFDAAREGCHSPLRMCGSSVEVFAKRWEFINKLGSWERDRNKWVAAYTFEILKEGL